MIITIFTVANTRLTKTGRKPSFSKPNVMPLLRKTVAFATTGKMIKFVN